MENYNTNLFDKYTKDNKEDADLWYRARHYVLKTLAPIDKDGIDYKSSDHVHVILENTSDILQAVARQIALIAHYPNYQECKGKNRTVITFCECKDIMLDTDKKIIVHKFESQMFGNLLNFCRCTYYCAKKEKLISMIQEESKLLPLDVEFVFTTESVGDYMNRMEAPQDSAVVIKETDIPDEYDKTLDESKGRLVNMVYTVGSDIDNLPPTDNANISRYNTALKTFCYNLKNENIDEKWNKGSITDKLSSIFCADCFESRLKGVVDINEKSLYENLLTDFETVIEKLCDEVVITALVKSEHARWNVEKLILGFRPLNAEERFKDESLFGKEKSDNRKDLKKNKKTHVDLCSYKELRRVDIGNMKYDYFLMLAMPQILLSYFKNH